MRYRGARHIDPPHSATCKSVTSINASHSPNSDSSNFGVGATLQRRRNAQRKTRTFHYRKVLYLMNWAWDIEVCRSHSGWNSSLRTYNIIPSDSLVFKLAGGGDVRGLLDLFAKRQASPFDVDEDGCSLLSVRFHCDLQPCKLFRNCFSINAQTTYTIRAGNIF